MRKHSGRCFSTILMLLTILCTFLTIRMANLRKSNPETRSYR